MNNNFDQFMFTNFPIPGVGFSSNNISSSTSMNNNMMDNGMMNNNFNNMKPNSNLNLFDSYEGYMKGNMFRNLYSEYKDYKPQRLTGENNKQEKLLRLGEISFAAHDLNLYLDTHPNDKEAIRVFNKYRSEANKLMEEYEKTYGPLVISSNSLNETPWAWDSAFPWEVDKNV